MYINTHTCTHTYIYIYIYFNQSRETGVGNNSVRTNSFDKGHHR